MTERDKQGPAQAPTLTQAKKEQRAIDARKAMSDYEARQAAIEANTARLRALRLARDAAEKAAADAAAADAPPKAPRAKGAKAAKAKPASLSGWLKDQKAGGHRS